MSETRCHCGLPLHYTNPFVREYMELLVKLKGEYVEVTVGSRTWRVQRHYLALHGLKAAEIETLGFEEVRARPQGREARPCRS